MNRLSTGLIHSDGTVAPPLYRKRGFQPPRSKYTVFGCKGEEDGRPNGSCDQVCGKLRGKIDRNEGYAGQKVKICLLLHGEVEASIYLHQPHEDVEPKNEHTEECRGFHVANFGGSYSSRSDKPSIYDDSSPHLEGGRTK